MLFGYGICLLGRNNAELSAIIPMVMMLTSFVAFRQVYLFIMSRVCNEIVPISLSYPAGWLLCSLLTGGYYYLSTREKKAK